LEKCLFDIFSFTWPREIAQHPGLFSSNLVPYPGRKKKENPLIFSFLVLVLPAGSRIIFSWIPVLIILAQNHVIPGETILEKRQSGVLSYSCFGRELNAHWATLLCPAALDRMKTIVASPLEILHSL